MEAFKFPLIVTNSDIILRFLVVKQHDYVLRFFGDSTNINW